MPEDAADRADGIKIGSRRGTHDLAAAGDPYQGLLLAQTAQFSYEYQVADHAGRRRRSPSSAAKPAMVFFDPWRTPGRGKALKVTATFATLADSMALLRDGRFEPKECRPASRAAWRLPSTCCSDFEGDHAEIEISVADTSLREYASRRSYVFRIEAKSADNLASQVRPGGYQGWRLHLCQPGPRISQAIARCRRRQR